MGNYNAAVLTDIGAAMLAQIQQGHTLTFTRIATGNGIYPDKSVDVLKTRSALLSEKQTFTITGKTVSGNEIKVSTLISNEELTTSYYINEVGLYAKVDDGPESLFSFAVATVDNTTLLEAYNGETPIMMTQSFVTTTSNAAEIQVVLPADAYALATDLEAETNARIQADFENLYGLCSKQTAIAEVSENTQITETDTYNHITAVTTIVKTSDTVTTITTVVTPQGDPYYYTKTTVITKGESTTTIAESYTRTAQS